MPCCKIITVSTTSEQDAFVRGRPASRRFASAGEVMRAALDLLQTAEAAAQRRGSVNAARNGPTSRA